MRTVNTWRWEPPGAETHHPPLVVQKAGNGCQGGSHHAVWRGLHIGADRGISRWTSTAQTRRVKGEGSVSEGTGALVTARCRRQQATYFWRKAHSYIHTQREEGRFDLDRHRLPRVFGVRDYRSLGGYDTPGLGQEASGRRAEKLLLAGVDNRFRTDGLLP